MNGQVRLLEIKRKLAEKTWRIEEWKEERERKEGGMEKRRYILDFFSSTIKYSLNPRERKSYFIDLFLFASLLATVLAWCSKILSFKHLLCIERSSFVCYLEIDLVINSFLGFIFNLALLSVSYLLSFIFVGYRTLDWHFCYFSTGEILLLFFFFQSF